MEYHHYQGYDREHRTDVLPLCRVCHRQAHQKEASEMVSLRSLRYWRERRALSQGELADKAGVSRATVIDLEACRSQPRPKTIRELARVLRVEPEQLMDAVEGD